MSFSLPTARLQLRDYEPGDFAVVRESFLDPEQAHYNLKWQASEWYVALRFEASVKTAQTQPRCHYDLAIVLRDSQTTIGFCSVEPTPNHTRIGRVSWHICKAFWGCGYATEAARRLLELGFLTLNFSEIEANAFTDNAASIRVMEKLGMRAAHNGGIASWWRGLSYGEARPVVSYHLQRQHWLANSLRQAARQPAPYGKAA